MLSLASRALVCGNLELKFLEFLNLIKFTLIFSQFNSSFKYYQFVNI